MRKTAKEMAVPTPAVSDRLSEAELGLGQAMAEVIRACEAQGFEAEAVLRHYCDALIETVKQTKA
jgi:hypothetical protein